MSALNMKRQGYLALTLMSLSVFVMHCNKKKGDSSVSSKAEPTIDGNYQVWESKSLVYNEILFEKAEEKLEVCKGSVLSAYSPIYADDKDADKYLFVTFSVSKGNGERSSLLFYTDKNDNLKRFFNSLAHDQKYIGPERDYITQALYSNTLHAEVFNAKDCGATGKQVRALSKVVLHNRLLKKSEIQFTLAEQDGRAKELETNDGVKRTVVAPGLEFYKNSTIVRRVVPSSEADTAKIVKGDVIVRVGDVRVSNAAEFKEQHELQGNQAADGNVTIATLRPGSKEELSIKLHAVDSKKQN